LIFRAENRLDADMVTLVFHVELSEHNPRGFHVEQRAVPFANLALPMAGLDGLESRQLMGLEPRLFHRRAIFELIKTALLEIEAIPSVEKGCGPGGEDGKSSFPQRSRVLHN
jgi:hypothetical protein